MATPPCYPWVVTTDPTDAPVLVRLPAERDLDPLMKLRRNPEVGRWLLHRRIDPATHRDAVLAPGPDRRRLVAELAGRVVGTGTLEVVDGWTQDDPGAPRRQEGSIGYLVDPSYAGRGVATALATAMLDLAFADLGLRRVTAGCFAANTASWKVMEKVGMRREQHGLGDSWHAELGWIDGFTYAVLAEEWCG